MTKLKISIITIAYNAVDYIEGTIRSILNQNYDNIEFILVDGGSNDGTCEKIEKLLPEIKNKCVDYSYTSEPDNGISDAFNKGIQRATGDIVGLINSGDGLMPGALCFINENWRSDDQIVYGKTLAIDEKYNLKYLREIPDNVDLDRMVYNGLIFTHQSAFVKRSIYTQYGLYDVTFKYVMDSDLFLHFYYDAHVKFRYLDFVLVSMLCGGISARISKNMIKEQIRISQKYGGYSAKIIWMNSIKEVPKTFIKDIIRRYPSIWYKIIGANRNYKE